MYGDDIFALHICTKKLLDSETEPSLIRFYKKKSIIKSYDNVCRNIISLSGILYVILEDRMQRVSIIRYSYMYILNELK